MKQMTRHRHSEDTHEGARYNDKSVFHADVMSNDFVPEGARSAPPVYIYCIHSTTQTGSLSRRSVTAHLPDTTETA